SSKVQLNPHEIYLIPQKRTYYHVAQSQIEIHPKPVGSHERINAEGNAFFQVWFDGETDIFEIAAHYEVVIKPFNPFGFILPNDTPFPFGQFEYPPELQYQLG